MSPSLPPCGPARLSADHLNDEMRRLLMTQPDTPERRETYRQLLDQWCVLVRDHVQPAA